MYRFSYGVPRWYKKAGVSVARPGVLAAAAALATAATSVCFADRFHPLVSPISCYAASPALLPSSSSSSGAFKLTGPYYSYGPRAATGNLSGDLWSSKSLALERRAPNFGTPRASAYSAPHLAACCSSLLRSFGVGVTSPVTGCASLAKEFHHLCHHAPSNPSLLRPSYLYSAVKRDELHSYFKVCTGKSVFTSSFADFVQSSTVIAPSWSLNSLSFDTFDLSSHLASFFSSTEVPLSHPAPSVISSKSLHEWHRPLPESQNSEEDATLPGTRPALTVVLLGWLGSQQKHLKKYAEWYNARGITAVTFTLPMADILSLSVGGKPEDFIDPLTDQLSSWLAEETKGDKSTERQLIFHTFSNTGWLTYGVVLENMSSKGNWTDRIKGCVVDSAPAADPDPQVWASGFSAALLKKSNGTPNGGGLRDSGIADARHPVLVETSKPHVAESALFALLQTFFSVFLQIPAVSDRLSQVVSVLSKEQPPCPQLYIYSTADKVIPSDLVESFMDKQRKQGRIVRSFNFQSSPHVDHFRSFPEIYSKQVSNFLQECLRSSPAERT